MSIRTAEPKQTRPEQARDQARAAFVAGHTVLTPAALAPDIVLHLATALTPLWQATEDFLAQHDMAPPYWAFAWPGAEALARHVLDHPALVAGRRVLDFAAGSGLAAIACARVGAASVEAAEIDPLGRAAIALNAAANGVALTVADGDVVGAACRWDVILCGDVFYEAPMTRRILPWLRRCAATAEVIVADPGRAYTPDAGRAELAVLPVPTILELEDSSSRMVALFHLQPR